MGVTLRHQLPAISPIGLREVGAAFRAALVGHPLERRDALARDIAGALDADRVLLTDSGTGALTLAIRSATSGKGPVALPAYGCYDLATACDGAGVDVVLYDVEPPTLGPDLDSLRAALGLGARAVVTGPPFGFTTYAPQVRRLCDEVGVPMIEDIAQCLWAETGAGPAGTLGDYVVLSFGRGKGVTAGRGGALLTRHHAGPGGGGELGGGPGGRWRDAAMLLALWVFGRPALFALPAAVPALRIGETIYHRPHEPGSMGDVGAAVLEHTWRAARAEVERRRQNAARLLDLFESRAAARPCRATDGSNPSFLRFPVLMAAADRARVSQAAARRLGVMPGYPRALSDLAGFGERCRPNPAGYPGASDLARHLAALPTHSRVGEADFRLLGEWIAAGP